MFKDKFLPLMLFVVQKRKERGVGLADVQNSSFETLEHDGDIKLPP